MKTRLAITTVLFLLFANVSDGALRPHPIYIAGAGEVLPMRGYYSDAISRHGIEFYASLTHDTNGQPVFEAVRVNPDNSQQIFPGIITSLNQRRISGVIPGRGKFRLKLSRDGTRATGILHLRPLAPGDIGVSGRLRMQGQQWEPETVTLSYGLVLQQLNGQSIQAIDLWKGDIVRPEFRREFTPVARDVSP